MGNETNDHGRRATARPARHRVAARHGQRPRARPSQRPRRRRLQLGHGASWTALSDRAYDATAETYAGTLPAGLTQESVLVRLRASDLAGNAFASPAAPVTVDLVPPTGALARGVEDVSSRITYTGVGDALSGLDPDTLALVVSLDEGASLGCARRGRLRRVGRHLRRADRRRRAERVGACAPARHDRMGNAFASAPQTVRVDTVAPSGRLERSATDVSRRVLHVGVLDALAGLVDDDGR